MEALWIMLALFWGLPIFVAHHLGLSRNRTGWLWGLFLGWLGVFIVALMRPVPLHEQIANAEAQRQLDERRLRPEQRQLLANHERTREP